MPKPKKYEQKEDFISRCIPIIIKEKGDDLKSGQAYAICKSVWDQDKNKDKKR